jgi:hypothetical protein
VDQRHDRWAPEDSLVVLVTDVVSVEQQPTNPLLEEVELAVAHPPP